MTKFQSHLYQLIISNDEQFGQLSKKLGFGVNTIRTYVSGTSEPTLGKLIKIADYFGVSLDWLVGRESFGNEEDEATNHE